jgi:hypothetical protein
LIPKQDDVFSDFTWTKRKFWDKKKELWL